MVTLGKAFDFYHLYVSKDWEGMFQLVCESVLGMTRGDALFNELKPLLDKHIGQV